MDYLLYVLLALATIAFPLIFISAFIYILILKFGNKYRLLHKLFLAVIVVLVIVLLAIVLVFILFESFCYRNVFLK